MFASGVQATALTLFARRAPVKRVVRFSLGVGVASLLLPAVLLGWPGADGLVFRGLMGLDGRLLELTVLAFTIFAVLPPFLALEELYAAALMRLKRTRALIWINGWRLLALLLWIGLVPTLTPWTGAAIGAAAITATLVLEAILTYAYGVRSMRELAEGDADAARAGSAGS